MLTYIGTWLEMHSPAITAVSTAAIAFFTVVLVCVSRVQAKLTRRAIALAREEFLATHRPRVAVRRISVDIDRAANKLGVQYTISNIGDSTATIIAISERLWLPDSSTNLPPLPPYDPPRIESIKLESGESELLRYDEPAGELLHIYDVQSGFAKAMIEDGKTVNGPELLFLGFVRYEDAIHRSRETAFLRRQDFTTKRFSPIEERDYEYQD